MLADKIGTVHDMRFVFLENDTKLLFATAYDGDWESYINDFAALIPDATVAEIRRGQKIASALDSLLDAASR